MRCSIKKHSKIMALSQKLGRKVVSATCRGGTNHRIDAYLENGMCVSLYRDGTVEENGFVSQVTDRMRIERRTRILNSQRLQRILGFNFKRGLGG